MKPEHLKVLREISEKIVLANVEAELQGKEFLAQAKKYCEFNQPEGGDGPECSHEEYFDIWCDSDSCPLITGE